MWLWYTNVKSVLNPYHMYSAKIFLYKPWRPMCFYNLNYQKCLSSFRLIWMCMLWVNPRPLYIFHFFQCGVAFRRGNLMSTDVRFWCLKTFPALKELNGYYWLYIHYSRWKASTQMPMLFQIWELETMYPFMLISRVNVYEDSPNNSKDQNCILEMELHSWAELIFSVQIIKSSIGYAICVNNSH